MSKIYIHIFRSFNPVDRKPEQKDANVYRSLQFYK